MGYDAWQEESVEETQQRENLFLLLKKALKARGYTYKMLASEMGVSELSIKRLFKEKDCKMSRLLEVCRIIDLSIDDLVSMQQRFKYTPEYLPIDVEEAIAADAKLFSLLILMVSKVDIETIQNAMGLSDPQLYTYLRQLENLGLIHLKTSKIYSFGVPLPIRWRINGPLSVLIKTINQHYIGYCLDNESKPDHAFVTSSRLMTENSLQKIQQSLEKVKEEYDYLSSQDQMFYQAGELKLVKLVFAMGPFPLEKILKELPNNQ